MPPSRATRHLREGPRAGRHRDHRHGRLRQLHRLQRVRHDRAREGRPSVRGGHHDAVRPDRVDDGRDFGLPDARTLVLDHPIGGTDRVTLERWADDAAEQGPSPCSPAAKRNERPNSDLAGRPHGTGHRRRRRDRPRRRRSCWPGAGASVVVNDIDPDPGALNGVAGAILGGGGRVSRWRSPPTSPTNPWRVEKPGGSGGYGLLRRPRHRGQQRRHDGRACGPVPVIELDGDYIHSHSRGEPRRDPPVLQRRKPGRWSAPAAAA